MKNLLLIAFLLFSVNCFAADVTPDQIAEAEQARVMSKKIGLDKATPEKMVEMALSMGDAKGDMTAAEREAMKCVIEKTMYIQFKAPIEEFAKFLTDEAHEEQLMQKFSKECGFNAPE